MLIPIFTKALSELIIHALPYDVVLWSLLVIISLTPATIFAIAAERKLRRAH